MDPTCKRMLSLVLTHARARTHLVYYTPSLAISLIRLL